MRGFFFFEEENHGFSNNQKTLSIWMKGKEIVLKNQTAKRNKRSLRQVMGEEEEERRSRERRARAVGRSCGDGERSGGVGRTGKESGRPST